MKSLLVAISMAMAAVALGLAPLDAHAKRLGGGKPAGMQRQAPANNTATNTATPPSPSATPAPNAAAPAAAPAAAAANAGKRSWMGPIAGLAAGLGLAALFSHLGMGEGFANVVMMVLLALVAFMVVRWLMRRFAGGGARQGAGGMQLAGAGAPLGGAFGTGNSQTMARESLPAAAPNTPSAAGTSAQVSTAAATLPGGMPSAEFERIAKLVFIRLQAANDAANVEDLRRFTTPELFASLKADLLERGSASQKTDVVQLDARVVETVEEAGQHIVTVRFQGLIREAADAGAEPFDELWHMVRPVDGSRDWAIAGIAPTS